MVRAILAGRKTQTRRIVKPQPTSLGHGVWQLGEVTCYSDEVMRDHLFHEVYGTKGTPYGSLWPYGGDRLWVRETVCLLDRDHWWDSSQPREFIYTTKHPRRNGCAYRSETDSEGERIRKEYGYKWTPAIHMPRWASRLTLEITDVRVQRLQEISGEDVFAEGVDNGKSNPTMGVRWENMQRMAFADLWSRINGPDSWNANPWVWAITFKRCE